MKSVIVLIALTLTGGAAAQEMHTCTVDGRKTIQDRPCKGAPIKMVQPDPPVDEATIQLASSLCEAAARAIMKDPEAARISNIHRSRTDNWCNPSRKVRYYWMMINGKNSYGGYTGDQPYRCALDISETDVLSVIQIRESEKTIPCR